MNDGIHAQLKQYGRVKLNEPMNKYTTFRVGGQARFFVSVKDNDRLVRLLNFLSSEDVEFMVIGAGSNLLFSDNGFDGVVIRAQTDAIDILDSEIAADAGVLLAKVLDIAVGRGFTGFEWAAGVPGTVGGAVCGNAGAYGQSINDSITSVVVWENGEVKNMTKAECGFNYRGSIFKDSPGIVILKARFELKPGDKVAIISKVQDYLRRRRSRFPQYPSAGCFFANVKLDDWTGDRTVLVPKFFEIGEVPAGWLVEQAGCKGLRVGGAEVSNQHCNFIINIGNATQADVLRLVEQVKERVYNKFGADLREEVVIIG